MRYGIHYYYPRLRRFLGEKIVAYVRLTRPFTLLAPCLAGLFGVLAPVRSITFRHFFTAIYVGVSLALLQAVGQIINQIVDADLDAMLPRKKNRPIVSGRVSKDEAYGIAWLLAIFGILRAFTVSIQFGIMSIILLAFAIYYSLPPFSPRKIHPLLNTGWMALSRGFLPMLAVWSVYGDISQAWPYAILAFIWVMGWQSSKDVPDVEADKTHGIKTIPNTWGVKGLQITMIFCLVWFGLSAVLFNLPSMLSLLPLGVISLATVKKEANLTENTYSWVCYYLGLGLIYIIAFVINFSVS
jgi:4-hydroxybenzoate polyprenyltransferase